MTQVEPAWAELTGRLRRFVAPRVPGPDVDDVIQDVLVRMQRGLAGLRDDQRLPAWMFQIARTAIADHGRVRARHPAPPAGAPAEPAAPPETPDDDREAARLLAGCLASMVARLPSPYREAITLIELEGLTGREAAAMTGVSLTAMKSRVRRGRIQLRAILEECCEVALDARGKVTGFTPRSCGPSGSCGPRS